MRFWWKNGFRLTVRKMGFNVQPVSSKEEKIYTFSHTHERKKIKRRWKKANKRQKDQMEFIFLAFFPWNKGEDEQSRKTFSPFPVRNIFHGFFSRCQRLQFQHAVAVSFHSRLYLWLHDSHISLSTRPKGSFISVHFM